MFGISLAAVLGYAVARWFGDAIKSIVEHTVAEVSKAIGEWL